jgi:hypothetical protein
MDIDQIFEFFKTHKNSCMGLLGTTDSEYGFHNQEIQNFGQFLPQTGNFR